MRCSWPGFRLYWKRGGPVRNGKFKVRDLEKHKGYGPRLTFLFRLTNSSNVLATQGKKTQDPPSQTEGGAPSVWL